MARDDHDPIQDVASEYWDALVRGEPLPTNLDPALGDTIRRVHALDDAHGPDPAFVTRLEREIMHGTDASTRLVPFPWQPRLTATRNGHVAKPLFSNSQSGRSSRQLLTSLATAALVLLTLVGSYFAFGGNLRLVLHEEAPAIIPAVVGTPEASPEPLEPVVEQLWETTGGPDTPLDGPTEMAVDPDGNLWVVDGNHSRFQIFAPDGTFRESWGTAGSGDGQFNFTEADQPRTNPAGDIAFDPEGNFYVADTGNFRIEKFGPGRAFLRAWGTEGLGEGQFLDVLSVAVGSDGSVYAADQNRNDVQRFDADGRFLNTIGRSGSGAGGLQAAAAVAIDSVGNVWVPDWATGLIERFSSDGRFLGAWGHPGLESGQLFAPIDVAIDATGRVWVVDSSRRDVQVFAPDGQYLTKVNRAGTVSHPGGFSAPTGIALSSDGHVYITDSAADLVTAFQIMPAAPVTAQAATASPPARSEAMAIPAAPATFTSTRLLDVAFPAGTLAEPTTGSDIWLFQHYAVRPGERIIYSKVCDTPDLVVRYVLAGTYAVKSSGPLTVIRQASGGVPTTEHVTAGQDVILQTGDALVYQNTSHDDYAGFRNPGPDRLDLLEWEWLDRDCLYAIPQGMDLLWDTWTRWQFSHPEQVPFDPTRPFTVRFRQMTAGPGTELPQDGPDGPGFLPPGMPGLEVAVAESGNVEVSGDAEPKFPLVEQTIHAPGGMVSDAAFLPSSATRTIRSTGDEPLLLYALTIVNTNEVGPATAIP